MDNPEKLSTLGTQYTGWRPIKHKNTTQKTKRFATATFRHHYPQTYKKTKKNPKQNKTWALLQTSGSKNEPNIVFMRKSNQTSQHETKNVSKHNRTRTQKIKRLETPTQKKPTEMNSGAHIWNKMLKSCICLSLYLLGISNHRQVESNRMLHYN